MIREPRKFDVTVCNCDIAKLQDYINSQGTRLLNKMTEAKIMRHSKEFTRIHQGDRKMKRRKRDTASGVSSTKSNIARAMPVCMPKTQAYCAPQIIVFSSNNYQPIITAPETKTTHKLPTIFHELQIPSTSAPSSTGSTLRINRNW